MSAFKRKITLTNPISYAGKTVATITIDSVHIDDNKEQLRVIYKYCEADGTLVTNQSGKFYNYDAGNPFGLPVSTAYSDATALVLIDEDYLLQNHGYPGTLGNI